MSEATATLTHPLLRCVQSVGVAVDEAAGADPSYLSAEQKAEALLGLTRVIGRLEGLRLAALAAAGDVAVESGARSAGAWLADEARLDPAVGRRWQRLADAVHVRHPLVGAALVDGSLDVARAEVIVSALDDLPREVDDEVREAAVRRLLADAAAFEPRRLRILGRRILEVVAPGVADEHERRLLERQEQRARQRMRMTVHDLGDGLRRAVVDLPSSVMERWLTQLHAYTSPRRDHLADGRRDPDSGRRIPYPRLLAQALCTMLEAGPGAALPRHGGDATTLMVTLDLESLRSGLGVAELSTGSVMSAAEARRLACNAQLVPVVLGGESQPLDLGRARRLFTPAQRKALAVRDGGCTVAGCDTPAAWCEAHHLTPWSAGGATDLADGVLLCSFHHHRAHDRRYDLTRHTNGELRFHRRR